MKIHTRKTILLAILGIGSATLISLTGCSSKQANNLNGYIEAESVRLAPSVAGRLQVLKVTRGDQVKAGQLLFQLDTENEQSAVSEASARLAQAQAQAADLASGKRPDELAVIEADVKVAIVNLKQAELDLKRQHDLAKSGFVSKATLDAMQTKRDAAQAQLAEAQAQLRAAQLAARKDSRLAAAAASDATQAQLQQREWIVQQKAGMAPMDARVEDYFYRVGEWVPAGSPVISLLAPNAIKARFWVAEPQLNAFKVGTKIVLHCDGCKSTVPATVSFVARDAEYTPPFIYSKENRAKLVWLVEARPDARPDGLNTTLLPGQPVDISLAAQP